MENDETRGLLRAYGASAAPSPGRKKAASEGIAAATSAPVASAPPRSGGGWLAKAGLAMVVLGALGSGAWLALGGGDEPRDRPSTPTLPTEPPRIAEAPPLSVTVTPAPPGPPSAPPEAVVVAPAAPRADETRTEVTPAPAPDAIEGPVVDVGSAEPVPTALGTLAAELVVLRRAQRALRDGDATAALAGLEEHREQFPDGALARDRDIARVSALCELGRADEAHVLAGELDALGENPAIVRALSRCVADR